MDGARPGKEPNFPMVTFSKNGALLVVFSKAYPRKEKRSDPRKLFGKEF